MLWLIGTLVEGTDIEGYSLRKQSRRKSIVQPFMIFYSLGQSLELGQGLFGCLEFLLGLSQVSAKGERIALDDRMDDRKEIGHAQTLQPFFGELDQGLGSVTDQVQHPGTEALQPLIHSRLPRGIGAIFRHLFQQQITRGEVHEDQDHVFQEGFIHGPNDLSYLTTREPVLLPAPRRLQ